MFVACISGLFILRCTPKKIHGVVIVASIVDGIEFLSISSKAKSILYFRYNVSSKVHRRAGIYRFRKSGFSSECEVCREAIVSEWLI